MNWPPIKAWTSKIPICGKRHFVAINYGGKSSDRWVILISVLDASLCLKIAWSQLLDPSIWECGWEENCQSNLSESYNQKSGIITNDYIEPSLDSGLTIPITKNIIRPWFGNT
tara:strand:+ start:759 stop:1097 length:339 start_codon:yes stop_codon:yes gene_type:complete